MFRKRSVKCPITVEDQKWITNNLNWINDNVVNILSQPTIEPTKQYFNWNFSGKEDDARFALDKIGDYINIETKSLQLEFFDENEESKLHFQSLCNQEKCIIDLMVYYSEDIGKYTIGIGFKEMENPNSLIAEIVYKLCHLVLVKFKGVCNEGEDFEGLTDLLMIANGFGIFINETMIISRGGLLQNLLGRQKTPLGYLPQQVMAYAMAEIEMRKQNRETPKWIKYCSTNFKSDFKKSMKYLKNQ